MPLIPGQLLRERYTIVRVLTSGGMGAVYEARDGHLDGAACAVKEMLEELLGTDDAELIKRKFEEEKALLARLKHPAIPAVRDFFRQNRLCYIVMDYIHGANLQQQLEDSMQLTGEPFAAEVLVKDILQVLDALIYLHELDPPVVHRDIKPANLIREFKTGKIMLVDFGLARAVSGTRTQTAVGTLGYSPLEQIQGRSEPRSDLYALGVTMHHLLTNRQPVPLEVTSLGVTDPGQDPALVAIVDRASAILPDERFASAREMRQALADWLAGRRSPPPTPGPARSSRLAPLPAATRGQTALVAGALLGTLLLGLLLGRAFTSAPEPVVVQVTPSPTPTPTPTPTPSPTTALVLASVSATPEIEPVKLPVATASPEPPRPTSSPSVSSSPPPARPVASRRPPARPGVEPSADYPRVRRGPFAPRKPASSRPLFSTLSGPLEPLRFRGYAMTLGLPQGFREEHHSQDKDRLDHRMRLEQDGITRQVLVQAVRAANAPDFVDGTLREHAQHWETIRPVSPPGELPQTYQLEGPDAIGVLTFLQGEEPSGPPVLYAVLISQQGQGVSIETLKPEASNILESIRWKRLPRYSEDGPPPPEGPLPPR